MTDQTPIDVKDAVKLQEGLTSLKTMGFETRDGLTGLRKFIDDKLADQAKEAKSFGAAFGDTKAKVEETAKIAGEMLGKLAAAEQTITKHHETIEKLHEAIQKRRSAGITDDVKKANEDRDNTAKWLQTKACENLAVNDPVPQIDADKVTDDQIKAYRGGKAALAKIMRMGLDVKETQHMYSLLSSDEQKMISTFTNGSRFNLGTEFSDMIISCYPMDTDLTGIVNSMTISRGAVEFMTDHYVGQDAYFKCETDCAPKPTMMEPNPGTLNIAVHELSADECITNTMLEDALINMEGWLAQKVGGKFIRRINNGILHGAGINGVGQGMMDGITNTNNHLTMMSGMVSGTPAGHFSWQDLMAMSIKLDPRFQANALWLLGTNVMVNLMTMADANGLPLFHQQVINGAGMPRLMGKPFVQVQQMPDYLNPDGTKKIGSKPIALGDWKSNYMLVHRRGFTMNRDPYSMMNCGVRYHFSQRIGGGVLCRNAAIFMQIK